MNATSAATKAEGADVEVGGTIGRRGATLLHVVVVVGGGMEGDLHQGEEDLRHDVETLLQGEVDLLLNDLGCSLLQGLLAGQVEEEEVDGESARGRRRNPGVPAAGTATDPQGGTRLLAEDLHREGAHRREEAALHAGMKDEAMLEVGDAEVGLHQEEARHRGVGLLPGGVLHLGEDLLLGVDHHHEEVPLQDVVEVLTTEVVPGGQDLVVEMIVARLEEALRQGGVLPQGGAPHLAEVRLQEGAPHQEEDLLLAGTRAAVTEAPGGEAEVAGMDRHQDVDRHQGEARHLGEALLQGVMDLLVMMAPLTGAATALLETTVLLLLGNRMIGLHPSPLASLTRAGPRWPSVNLKWFTFGPVSSF